MILPAAFEAATALTLARLAARLAGREEPSAPTPLAVALALAATVPLPVRDELARAPLGGRVIVQERLVVAVQGAFSPETPVSAEAVVEDDGTAAVLRLRFAQLETGATASLEAGLLRVGAPSLTAAGPDASARIAGAERQGAHPLDADAVTAYLAAVRDPNPIHRDACLATELGLAAPLVPGGLLALVAEAAAGPRLGPGPRTLSARFAAPAPVGARLEVALLPGAGEAGRAAMRVLLLTPDLRLVAAVDLRAAAS